MPEIAAVFNVVPPAAESSTGRIVYFTYAMAFCCRTCICYSELDGSEPHTQYALPATALCYLKHDANEMHFYYDAQSRPTMVDFNGICTDTIYKAISPDWLTAATTSW